ncbi:MAG: class I SAM-dependent methyltransferase [Candidatus Methanospirareceae archaeon]
MVFDSKYFEDRKIISHEVLTEVEEARRHLKGRTVLDVACGTGRHGYLLEYYDYVVTYLDVSQEALKNIWWSGRKIRRDFLSYETCERFDNVVSFQFIEHLDNSQLVKALEKMKKIARYRIINTTIHPNHVEYGKDPSHVRRSYQELLDVYLSVLPNTRIYRYDNKFRGNPKAWIRGLFEKMRPHYFENLMFVTEV